MEDQDMRPEPAIGGREERSHAERCFGGVEKADCPFCSEPFDVGHWDRENGVATGICLTCRELVAAEVPGGR